MITKKQTKGTTEGITVLEIVVLVAILAVFAVYSIPVFFTPKEQKQQASVRANTAMAVSAITGRFALKKKKFTANEIAVMTAETLNEHVKNPVNKSNEAYTLSSPTEGVVVLIPDNKKKLIEIKGYYKDLDEPLITRVVHGYEHNRIQEGTQEGTQK